MRKHFVGKDFESITEMDNLDTVVVENVLSENNDFLRDLHCCWRQTVGGNFFIFPKISNFYIGYEGIIEQGF